MNAIKDYFKSIWRMIGLMLGKVLPTNTSEIGGYIVLAVMVVALLVGWAGSVYGAYVYGSGRSRASEIAAEGALDSQIEMMQSESAAQIEAESEYNYYRALFDMCMFNTGDVRGCNTSVKKLAAEYGDQLYSAPSPDFDWP